MNLFHAGPVAPFRDQVWIATKVGGGVYGKADCSAARVVASCDESLRRLQADRIDLYQIHFWMQSAPKLGFTA